jgi:hypothetical protein
VVAALATRSGLTPPVQAFGAPKIADDDQDQVWIPLPCQRGRYPALAQYQGPVNSQAG